MHELVHLMKKDARYLYWRAGASWLVAATAWLWVYMPRVSEIAAVHLPLTQLAPLLVVTQLFQLDPAVGSSSFWLTRPMNRGKVLLSKTLIGLLAVVLPCALINVAPLLFLGLELTARDYAAAFLSRFGLLLMGTALFAMAAALTRRLAEMFVLVPACAALTFVGIAALDHVWPEPPGREEASFQAVLPLLLALQTAVFLLRLYGTRRFRDPLAVLFVCLGLVLVAQRSWHWDLMQPLRPSSPARAAVTKRDWPMAVKIDGASPVWRSSSTGVTATAFVRIEGLPDGLALRPTGYSARLETMRGNRIGETFTASMALEGHDVMGGHSMPTGWQVALGCRGPEPARGSVRVFHRRHSVEPWAVGETYVLTGSLHFDVVRPFVTQRAPVAGGHLTVPGGRHTLKRVPESVAAAGVLVRTERLRTVPFPDPGYGREDQLGLFDPASGQCLTATSEMDSRNRLGGPFLPVIVYERRYRDWSRVGASGPPHFDPIPETAEVVIVDGEIVGTFEAPFRIEVPGAMASGS